MTFGKEILPDGILRFFIKPVESKEIVAGVKKNKVPVEYITYPDEGHGFAKKGNQINTAKKHWSFWINT